jgi:hypothetical protein
MVVSIGPAEASADSLWIIDFLWARDFAVAITAVQSGRRLNLPGPSTKKYLSTKFPSRACKGPSHLILFPYHDDLTI